MNAVVLRVINCVALDPDISVDGHTAIVASNAVGSVYDGTTDVKNRVVINVHVQARPRATGKGDARVTASCHVVSSNRHAIPTV